MHLKKVNKDFPTDYDVLQISETEYILGTSQKKRYKYIDQDGKQYPIKKHHCVYKLLQDLATYDLTNLEERTEYLAVLDVAQTIDDHGLISSQLQKSSNNMKVLTGIADLESFIERLEAAESKLAQIYKNLDIVELQEQRAKKVKPAITFEANGGKGNGIITP